MYVTSKYEGSVGKLHKEASSLVNAKAQADFLRSIWDQLDEEEKAIFKRGRNAKSSTVPKNANLTDYRYATGLEALIGFLFLDGKHERLIKILKLIK